MISETKIRFLVDDTNIYIRYIYNILDLVDDISTNGRGVLYAPAEARYNLKEARKRIDAALAILDGAEWPANEDYDE